MKQYFDKKIETICDALNEYDGKIFCLSEKLYTRRQKRKTSWSRSFFFDKQIQRITALRIQPINNTNALFVSFFSITFLI